MVDVVGVASAAERLGIVGILVAALVLLTVGAAKGMWVPGYQYRAVVAERDRLLELLLRNGGVADKALTLASEKNRDAGV